MQDLNKIVLCELHESHLICFLTHILFSLYVTKIHPHFNNDTKHPFPDTTLFSFSDQRPGTRDQDQGSQSGSGRTSYLSNPVEDHLNKFSDAETSSNALSYFILVSVLAIVFYLVFHNKQRVSENFSSWMVILVGTKLAKTAIQMEREARLEAEAYLSSQANLIW